MTQVALLVEAPNKSDSKVKCPFCNKDLHPIKGEKEKKPNYDVKSDPDALGCSDMSNFSGDYPWSMAKHHLISARQAFAQLKRIVRMAKKVGYDINCKQNGIGLPTISSKTSYPAPDGTKQSYGWDHKGKDPDRKKRIAYTVMKKAEAQWHVGHHAITLELKPPKDWGNESGEATEGHLIRYDCEVVKKLIKIMDKWQQKSDDICKSEDENNGDKFVKDMNDLSKEIANHLNFFGTDKPGNSYPLFVSKLAFEYAEEKDGDTMRYIESLNLYGEKKSKKVDVVTEIV